MADIFISYKREDADICAAFASALTAHGYTVWFDRDIHDGASWDRVIEREIRSAAAVLVLWSRRSCDSDWVRNEARVGKQSAKLVPVRIEHCELPLEFAAIQTADVFSLTSFAKTPGWTRLLDRIDDLVGRQRPAAAHGVPPIFDTSPDPTPKPPNNRTLLMVITALLAVIAVSMAGMASWLRQRPAVEAAEQAVAVSTIAIPAQQLEATTDALPVNQTAPQSAPGVTDAATQGERAEANVEENTVQTPCEMAAAQFAAQPAYLADFTVEFDQNSARLSRQEQYVVRQAAEYYLSRPAGDVVRVVGERRRRQVVYDQLIAQGLPAHRVSMSPPICDQDRAQHALEVRIWLGR